MHFLKDYSNNNNTQEPSFWGHTCNSEDGSHNQQDANSKIEIHFHSLGDEQRTGIQISLFYLVKCIDVVKQCS